MMNYVEVMLKTLVVLHRTLRDGSQPLIAQGIKENGDKLIRNLSSERELPAHWTDAALISKYFKYLAMHISSTVDLRQEVPCSLVVF